VQKEATADLGAAKALVAASGAVNGHHGLFEKIGLIGARDHSQLSQARRSFIAGDAPGAAAGALAAEKTVADAASAGKLRTGAVVGLIVLLYSSVGLCGGGRDAARGRRRTPARRAIRRPDCRIPFWISICFRGLFRAPNPRTGRSQPISAGKLPSDVVPLVLRSHFLAGAGHPAFAATVHFGGRFFVV